MDTTNNIFLRSQKDYVRDLDIIGNATTMAAEYLHIQTGKSIEECINFVKGQIDSTGLFPLKPIDLKGIDRLPTGDRYKCVRSFNDVLDNVIKTNSIIAPNMVIYDSPAVSTSCTAQYLDKKMALRNVVKVDGMLAKQRGDMNTFSFCNNEEYGIKILNNSISGSRASPHNPLYNKTGHSSLTATCRVLVSYSNSSVERFISGNRHYWSKDVVIENILSIISNTDYTKLENVIRNYHIEIPTVNQVMWVIKRCTKFYWINEVADKEIYEFISRLTDLQRAIFVYNGDLFNLAKLNDQLVRTIITEYITVNTDVNLTIDDADIIIKKSNADIKSLMGILCSHILAGGVIHDLRTSNPDDYILCAKAALHIHSVGVKYMDLFQTLFITDSPPPSIFEFPTSIRRNVVGSDTDSTMFTVQDWVSWYFKDGEYSDKRSKVSNTLCYLNSQVTAHWLALASRQMGVEDKNLYKLEMKNEYAFEVYMRANRAKHYATLMSSREGNVFKTPMIDIKGVSLKDSKVPKFIIMGAEIEFRNIMTDIMNNKGVSAYKIMQKIANLEHFIYNSLTEGKIDYLSSVNISPRGAYKLPMSSNYMHYDLYEKVLQFKYGAIAAPPYRAIKISTLLDKPKKVEQWILSLDVTIQESFFNWLSQFSDIDHETGQLEKPKKELNMLLLPYDIFANGLPPEFTCIIDKRSIIAELMHSLYIILEMLGFYLRNRCDTGLLMDDIPYRPEHGLPGGINID